jgi:hypothetical protein
LVSLLRSAAIADVVTLKKKMILKRFRPKGDTFILGFNLPNFLINGRMSAKIEMEY